MADSFSDFSRDPVPRDGAMLRLRLFAHSLRPVAQFHAEFFSRDQVILGKMSSSSMAFKLHFAQANEKSISKIAVSVPRAVASAAFIASPPGAPTRLNDRASISTTSGLW
jgi:hypothetical protein